MLRNSARIIALVAAALLLAACGGPDDATSELAAACERQISQVHSGEEGTPTAKSTTEKLEGTTLVECAGQQTRIVAADAEVEAPAGEGEAEGEGGEAEGEGGEAVELDPAARESFISSCAGCHTLSDADATGAVGPNLDETELDAAGVAEIIENGKGAMPPGLLEGEEAEAVAEYVAAAAGA